MAVWGELKKVVNSDFSKPLNELLTNSTNGLGALKTLIDKYRPWYAIAGTSVTLYSNTTATSITATTTDTDKSVLLGTVVIPRTGHYRVDAVCMGVNGHTSAITMGLYVYLVGENDNTIVLKSEKSVASGASATFTLSAKETCFFSEGEKVFIYPHLDVAGSAAASACDDGTLTSLTIKYSKQQITY